MKHSKNEQLLCIKSFILTGETDGFLKNKRYEILDVLETKQQPYVIKDSVLCTYNVSDDFIKEYFVPLRCLKLKKILCIK